MPIERYTGQSLKQQEHKSIGLDYGRDDFVVYHPNLDIAEVLARGSLKECCEFISQKLPALESAVNDLVYGLPEHTDIQDFLV